MALHRAAARRPTRLWQQELVLTRSGSGTGGAADRRQTRADTSGHESFVYRSIIKIRYSRCVHHNSHCDHGVLGAGGAGQGSTSGTYGQIAAVLFVYEIDLRLALHTKLCVATGHKLHATESGD